MKRIIPGIIIVLAVLGIGYSFMAPSTSKEALSAAATANANATAQAAGSHQAGGPDDPDLGAGDNRKADVTDDADDLKSEVKPASESYKNADEALEAVKKAAADYDDTILEQFTLPGEDCTWCGKFYSSIKDMMGNADLKPEQRSYYAELLAISGRTENLSALIDAYKGATKPEDKELYTQALELTLGHDNVVTFLGQQLGETDSSDLKEALVAAITNQGSPLAVDTLYNQTVKSGDPDGFYSQGIGLGEMIPDAEALPKLQEIVQKRDAFSHLAVKALLNSGMEGLKIVMDLLANSSDPEFDKRMLKDAKDHVNYDEDVEAYLKKMSESTKQPLVSQFANDVLTDFNNTNDVNEVPLVPDASSPAPMSSN